MEERVFWAVSFAGRRIVVLEGEIKFGVGGKEGP